MPLKKRQTSGLGTRNERCTDGINRKMRSPLVENDSNAWSRCLVQRAGIWNRAHHVLDFSNAALFTEIAR